MDADKNAVVPNIKNDETVQKSSTYQSALDLQILEEPYLSEANKNDVVEIQTDTVAETLEQEEAKVSFPSNIIDLIKTSKGEAVENIEKSIEIKTFPNGDNCVICIDTDDEEEIDMEKRSNIKKARQPDEPSKETDPIEITETDPIEITETDPIEITETDPIEIIETDPIEITETDISAPAIIATSETQNENKKRSSHELSSPSHEIDQQTLNGPPLKIPRLPKLLECVNNECPKDYNSTYAIAPQFILNFFSVSSKSNKQQFVCTKCCNKAIKKFELMSGALLQGLPVCDIELPKHTELVEIIDSDEEEEKEAEHNDEVEVVDDSKKIVWDQHIMNEFENIVLNYKNKIDFQQQADWDNNRLKIMQDKQDESLIELDVKLKLLEKQSANMYSNLYNVRKTKVERRLSISITDDMEDQRCQSPDVPRESIRPVAQYPPARNAKNNLNGFQINPCDKIQKQGNFSFAVRSKLSDIRSGNVWSKCKLLEMITTTENGISKKMYRVQFLDNLPNSIAIVSGRDLSFSEPSETLNVGTRVIAQFNRNMPTKENELLGYRRFLPGVIGEKLNAYNKRRYLVFCDYGHVRYILSSEVRQVVEQSENVVDDLHKNLKSFMTDYMKLMSMTQNQRPLFNVRRGQRVPVELNGEWRNAVVIEIDCSIIKVHFAAENSDEWIYRGSKRLGPIFTQATRSPLNFQKRNDQSISYITVGDDEESDNDKSPVTSNEQPKSVAKKSTSKKSTNPVRLSQSGSSTTPSIPPAASESAVQKVHILNDDKIYIDEPPQVSMLRRFTPRKDITAKKYVPHTCGRQCYTGSKSMLSSYSPLTKPLLLCWERQILKHKNKKQIIYKAPCGRRLRNMNEVHIYLKCTKNKLNVDNFDFDPVITVLSFYDVDKSACGLYLEDLAEGKEGMMIPVVNAFDDQKPPNMIYSSVRIPTKNVRIDKDPGFLMCCDCTDDCADKSKCACFQNTIAGAKFRNIMALPEEDISYKFKRLHNMVQTGIYECNQKCKCNNRCFNRVVQLPIQIKMQLYRTKNRGWGLECCHDIPKGTFICTYVGYLYPEREANALCTNEAHGDEYFAELDYIENVQGLKEGYEAGVQFDSDDDEDDDEKNSDSDSDYNEKMDLQDDYCTKSAVTTSEGAITTRSSTQMRPKRSGSGKKGNKSEDEVTLEEQKEKEDSATPGTSKSRSISSSSTDDENPPNPKKHLIDLVSDDEIINTMPDDTKMAPPPANMSTKSIRKMFGPKERVYILDAKQCGNVGRYFNHSCQPNLFVQSVFVDSHDPRFPWVSFFASRTIKAGEELTWNYNYDVGSVPGKVLYCKCGSKNCRTRIL
ncbi:unnamed protein product [Diamesa serratosioi]